MYVIAGATGNTGNRIANLLLDAGQKVKAISRSEEKLSALVAKGAIPAVGDLTDKAFLTQAFDDAESIYALIPPKFDAVDFRAYQNSVGNAFVEAVMATGVKNVITLSSFGAHLEENTGVILGLHDFEQALAKIEGINVLNLRAGFFMENFYGMIGTIQQVGVLGGFPIAGDVAIPVVHTRDIATVAADHFLKQNFKGQSHQYVAGERDLTMSESAQILGKAIGKDELAWVQFPYDQAREAMLQMGTSPSLADAYIEFCQRVNDGTLQSDYQRTPENTTETSIEDFSEEFARAYRQQS